MTSSIPTRSLTLTLPQFDQLQALFYLVLNSPNILAIFNDEECSIFHNIALLLGLTPSQLLPILSSIPDDNV